MCLGVPGRVTRTTDIGGLRMGQVDFGGVVREVCLAYVPQAGTGDYVIVHLGFAVDVVEDEEARRILTILRAMGDTPDTAAPATTERAPRP